jgi:AraC family transcriptional regulator of arabinose operon
MDGCQEEGVARFTNSARYKCLEYLKKNAVDLYLCYCGIEECDPGHHFGPTSRTEFLLHFILAGKGKYFVDDKIYPLGENELFLICPGATTYYEADAEDPWTYLWIGFNGIKAKTYLEYANLGEAALVGEFGEPKVLLSCVENMLDASKLTYENELKREGYLFLFLSALIGAREKSGSDTYDYS